MHEKDDQSVMRTSRLITCLDDRGHPISVGAGITDDDQVVLLGPPDGKAVLTPDQSEHYLAIIREMLMKASSPG